MSLLRKQTQMDSHSLTRSCCCPVTHKPRRPVLEPLCISQDRSKQSSLEPQHFLLISFKEKAFFFSCSPNDEVKERDFSSLISLTCSRKEGRKRRATVISQGPPQKGGTEGHFLSIRPLRRGAARLCQCHSPFCGGQAARGHPLPSPVDTHTLLPARLPSRTGGRGD